MGPARPGALHVFPLVVALEGEPAQQVCCGTDHTLVLVDGVEYRSATAGQAAIEDLPVEQIERIEIVRGPRSSLYGSDAIGGYRILLEVDRA